MGLGVAVSEVRGESAHVLTLTATVGDLLQWHPICTCSRPTAALVYLAGQQAVLYRSRMNPSLGRNLEARRPPKPNGAVAAAHPPPRRCSASWARHVAKVYQADPLVCTRCGRRTGLIGVAEHGGGRSVPAQWERPPQPSATLTVPSLRCRLAEHWRPAR